VDTHNNQKKINILYIIDTLCGEGGTENHLSYLARFINKEKFDCSIVSFTIWGSFADRIRASGIKVYHIPVARYYTPKVFPRCFELRKIIKDNMIDIVQTFHYKSDTFGVVTSRLSGVKHVISSRRDIGDTKNRIHIIINKFCNTLIEQFITVCDAVGDRLKADENVPESKQTRIYNGVDLNKYKLPDKDVTIRERRSLAIKEDDFVIGYVANFRPEKNHDVFFEALTKVKAEIHELKVVVVGDGPTEENCRRYCRDNGLDNIVLFIGRKNDVRKYIAVMDVACLVPGSNEGFSNSILEKMSMGKPMIVTDVGGNAESVIDGENGIVIPPLDSQKLADAIQYLYRNSSIRKEMGRKSRERVEKFFALDNMIKAHEEFYEKILNTK